jgi:hypothetical protein
MAAAKTPRETKPITAIDALAKLQRILNQLDATERKRVLAFLSAE